tara:strand:+ start:2111 stop:2467 length:357 start_codon:yes stop_codon:yes gene_type:complete
LPGAPTPAHPAEITRTDVRPSLAQFEVSDDADSMQMLQRSTQVGEFYYMMSPPVQWNDADKDKHLNYLGTRESYDDRSTPLSKRVFRPLTVCVRVFLRAIRRHHHLRRGGRQARAHPL